MSWQDPLVVVAAVGVAAIVAILALALLPGTPAFRQLVVGVRASPALVGLVRALLVYCVPLAVSAAVAYLNEWTDPRLLPLVPILVGALRVVEAQFDQAMKPKANRVDPPPVAGGGDADLARP